MLLLPVLDEPGPLRIVATGTGDEQVVWVLDGTEAARTADGEAATLQAGVGEHELWAVSDSDARWQAMARSEPAGQDGLLYVPAWSARHEPQGPSSAWRLPPWAGPACIAAAGILLLAPRSRSKSP